MIRNYNPRNNKEVQKLLSVLVDQAFMSVTTLLTTVVLARTYSKDNYADIVLLFAITIFILGFQSALISKPYAINLNDFRDVKDTSYFNFSLQLKISFTLGVIFLFPLLYYLSFKQWDSNKFLIYLGYVIGHSSYFFIRETLLSERKTVQNLKYGIFISISLLSLLGYIFFSKDQNIYLYLGLASIIYMLASLIYLLFNYRRSKLYKKDYKKFWNSNWFVGRWLMGANLFFHISSNIYPWLLLYITSKEDIAIFGVLMSIAGLVNPILTALSSYLLPIFVNINNNYNKLNSKVNKWVFLFILMAIVLVSIGYFGGKYIIELLFGSKYGALGLLTLYPFIVQAITIAFQPFKIVLNAIKRTDVNFKILVPRSIIALVLGFFLISKFGLHGVFYTMLIENLFYQLFYFMIYRKILATKIKYGS